MKNNDRANRTSLMLDFKGRVVDEGRSHQKVGVVVNVLDEVGLTNADPDRPLTSGLKPAELSIVLSILKGSSINSFFCSPSI